MLRVKKLKYEYENTNFEFDFEANNGEITAIIGESGAGKSTLLSLIAGFLEAKSGDILLNEQSLINKVAHKRELSILFQENNLFSHLSIFDNIALGVNPKLKLSHKEKENIKNIAKSLKIETLLNRLPNQISGGQKQRAALCRVIIRKKPLLLLDEPFSALDEKLREQMLKQIKTLAQSENICIIMVTHQNEDAKKVASKIVRIQNGRSIIS